MNILLVGSRGLLGSALADRLDIEKIKYDAPSRTILDITKEESVKKYMRQKSYDKIVLCAAYTSVDKAEQEQEICYKTNALGVSYFLEWATPILHFSSDYVFDAPPKIKISENYPRDPLNFYGQSKVQAEVFLEKSAVPFWNIRTSWLFGEQKPNFITKIQQKAETEATVKVVSDQVGRPTYVRDLADIVVRRFIISSPPSGHFHLQNTGPAISWADLAEFVLQYKKDTTPIQKVSSHSMSFLAKRPQNSLLENTKLPENLRRWDLAILDYLKQIES